MEQKARSVVQIWKCERREYIYGMMRRAANEVVADRRSLPKPLLIIGHELGRGCCFAWMQSKMGARTAKPGVRGLDLQPAVRHRFCHGSDAALQASPNWEGPGSREYLVPASPASNAERTSTRCSRYLVPARFCEFSSHTCRQASSPRIPIQRAVVVREHRNGT